MSDLGGSFNFLMHFLGFPWHSEHFSIFDPLPLVVPLVNKVETKGPPSAPWWHLWWTKLKLKDPPPLCTEGQKIRKHYLRIILRMCAVNMHGPHRLESVLAPKPVHRFLENPDDPQIWLLGWPLARHQCPKIHETSSSTASIRHHNSHQYIYRHTISLNPPAVFLALTNMTVGSIFNYNINQ